MTVKKKRTTWIYDSVEISIDEVKDLGIFLEEKGKVSIAQAKKHLNSVLKRIWAKIGRQEFEGYPHLLLKKKGKLPQN